MLSEFRVFGQEHTGAKVQGTLLAHPHRPNTYLIYAQRSNTFSGFGFVLANKDILSIETPGGDVIPSGDLSILSRPFVNRTQLDTVVHFYQSICALPAFQDGYSYMMEFNLDPTFVLQMRRFRKIEEGSSVHCSWKDEYGVFKTDLTFGLTPPEGIVLPLYSRILDNAMLRSSPISGLDSIDEALQKFSTNSKGFVFEPLSCDSYATTFVPNIQAIVAGGFTKHFTHGGLEDLVKAPIYMLGIKSFLQDAPLRCGSMLRLFSNGVEGYVKIEKP